jgi:Lipocalin-like domain
MHMRMEDRPKPESGDEPDSAKVLGIWKLVSLEIEVQGTGRMEPPMGENPTGYAVFTQEGRAFFILTGELREPATNDEQRAGLLNTLVAYTGMYRVEGGKWITKVEVVWNPEWVGSEQTRFFKLEGNRLKVLSPWRVMPNWPDKGMTRSILNFDRSK